MYTRTVDALMPFAPVITGCDTIYLSNRGKIGQKPRQHQKEADDYVLEKIGSYFLSLTRTTQGKGYPGKSTEVQLILCKCIISWGYCKVIPTVTIPTPPQSPHIHPSPQR